MTSGGDGGLNKDGGSVGGGGCGALGGMLRRLEDDGIPIVIYTEKMTLRVVHKKLYWTM